MDLVTPSRCKWVVSALHGARVEVTPLEVELATDCLSSSSLRWVQEINYDSLNLQVWRTLPQKRTIPSTTRGLRLAVTWFGS